MSPAYGRPQGEGVSGSCGRMWTGGGGIKNLIFYGRHKWMAPFSFGTVSFQAIT